MKKNILSIITALFATVSFAQINYTDINPDVTLLASASDSYPIDIDGGGVVDLIVFASVQDTSVSGFPTTLTGVAISTMGTTEIIAQAVVLGAETVIMADTLHAGSVIDVNRTYMNSSTPSVSPGVGLGINSVSGFGSSNLGDFVNAGPLYFGVKFDIGANTHYGWVRVEVANNAVSGVLFEYGYEGTPNTAIGAGELSTSQFVGVSSAVNDEVAIFSYGKKVIIQGESINGTLEVINLIGKTVYNNRIAGKSTIDLSDLTEGIYLVSYSEGNQRLTKKVLIK